MSEQRTTPIRYRDHHGHVWTEHATGFRREGYAAGIISLTALSAEHGPLEPVEPAAALCGARCPLGHTHTCARSPKHLGPHRDVQQKGDESCSWSDTDPCTNFTFDPDAPDIAVYCEHPGGESHRGLHSAPSAGLTWGTPLAPFSKGDQVRQRYGDARVRTVTGVVQTGPRTGYLYLDGGTRNGIGPVDPSGYVRTDAPRPNPDGTTTRTTRVQRACNGCGRALRQVTPEVVEIAVGPLPDVTGECLACTPNHQVLLLSEITGETSGDVVDLLVEDADALWEKAYTAWSIDRADLDRYKHGHDPVLDRVAQLERDTGRLEKRTDEMFAVDGRIVTRVDAAEKELRALTDRLRPVEYTVGPQVWSEAAAPGGMVCSAASSTGSGGICGVPVESEPCREHSLDGRLAAMQDQVNDLLARVNALGLAVPPRASDDRSSFITPGTDG